MELLEFKNLPDTSTPINAENLNHNFGELKPSFAQMYTNGLTEFSSEAVVSEWMSNDDTTVTWSRNVSVGDFVCQPENNRIYIPKGSAKHIRIYMNLAGSGNANGSLRLEDENGNKENSKFLYQPSGNTYFQIFAINRIITIPDTSKDYYLYMYLAPYNSTSFDMNNGFGSRSTYMGVEKLD